MNLGALSLESAPDFWTPLRFFLTVPVFGMVAAAVMLAGGGDLTLSRWQPTLLAAVHALTLGYLVMAMSGALLQMLPVVMGAAFPRAKNAAAVLHLMLTMGTLCLVAAFILQVPALFAAALMLLVPMLFLLAGGVLFALSRTGQVRATTQCVRLAAVALMVTVLMGGWIGSGYAFASMPMLRGLTDTHAAWGVIGWVLVLVIGVSAQVIPMFLATPPYAGKFNQRLAYVLMVLLCAGSLLPGAASKQIAVILVSLLMIAYALFTLLLLGKRRRKRRDVTAAFWRVGMLCLLLGAAILLYNALGGGLSDNKAQLLVGVLLLAGFAQSVINGMLYKIVPFLVWLNLRMPVLRGQVAAGTRLYTPNIHEVIELRPMQWQFLFFTAGLALLAVAVILGGGWVYAAALVMLVANLLLLMNLMRAVRLYRKYSGQPVAVR